MTTIAYDQPVADYVDRLSATGHVTHDSYKKLFVTIHNNDGNLSFDDLLRVWTTRKSSTQFDVDDSGAVAQFVKVDEYAWANGSTDGNKHSIDIEMANSIGPNGEDGFVADVTWHSAARLAGWLFANVIGARPSESNFFQHNHWSATSCPGPYIKSIWGQVLEATQAAYDVFISGGGEPVKGPDHTQYQPQGDDNVASKAPETVRQGSSGVGVAIWQGVCTAYGHPTAIDGSFGPNTAASTRATQATLGFTGNDLDAVVGKNTWGRALGTTFA